MECSIIKQGQAIDDNASHSLCKQAFINKDMLPIPVSPI
jgi:hypothetical protein